MNLSKFIKPKSLNELLTLLALVVGLITGIWGAWKIWKGYSYHIFYEHKVIETIKKTVVEDALR